MYEITIDDDEIGPVTTLTAARMVAARYGIEVIEPAGADGNWLVELPEDLAVLMEDDGGFEMTEYGYTVCGTMP
jgi:hypothetical protein